jgi:type VI secretion system protein ImpA
MTLIDVPLLLQPIDPDRPCGSDLEYSPAFLEAARALEGSPEVQYGSMHVAAVEADWSHVKAATLDLMTQSRDLRLAVWLTRSLVAIHGAAAVAEGLALIEGLLARYWDALHPQLDLDDDLDPTARLNTLLSLDEKTGFVRDLSSAPLVVSSEHGPVSLDDIERAVSESGSDAPSIEAVAVDAVFANAPIDEVTAVHDALANAESSLKRIDAQLNERVGHRCAVTLGALERVLAHAKRAVAVQLARHPARVALERDACGPSSRGSEQHDAGRITDRDDVIRTLERLCAYYAVAEPSSPVPILLHRARSLVGMRFTDLVADLTPAGVEQAKHWAGSAQP